KERTAERPPGSVTRMTTLEAPSWPRIGVHEKAPCESMLAPPGPLSMLYVSVSPSGSLADTENDSVAFTLTVWSLMGARVGGWLVTWIVVDFTSDRPPGSVARTVTVQDPTCDQEGVQVNWPSAVMLAPSGASSRLKVTGSPSGSLAVARNDTVCMGG